jgi:hypothetical protein
MMPDMNSPTVITLDRSRRMNRAVAASRRLRATKPDRRERERSSGRVWVNGGELGGAREAFAHLAESYD